VVPSGITQGWVCPLVNDQQTYSHKYVMPLLEESSNALQQNQGFQYIKNFIWLQSIIVEGG
jgi:hypothetical protein